MMAHQTPDTRRVCQNGTPGCGHDWRDYRRGRARCADSRVSHAEKWRAEYAARKAENESAQKAETAA